MQRRGVLTGAVIVLQLAGDGGTVLLFSVYRVRSIYHIPSTLILDSRVLCDQHLNERTQQRFASLSDIVHKLKETEVKREFLL